MTGLRSDLVFAMPFSNVLHLSFLDKIEATRLAGFQQMSIQPQEVLKLAGEGLSVADMRSIAADGGVRLRALIRSAHGCPTGGLPISGPTTPRLTTSRPRSFSISAISLAANI